MCGWHGMACFCVRNLHQWLTMASLHSMLLCRADPAGPLHTQALGDWPLRHYPTGIPPQEKGACMRSLLFIQPASNRRSATGHKIHLLREVPLFT